jgi:hypothetical protein
MKLKDFANCLLRLGYTPRELFVKIGYHGTSATRKLTTIFGELKPNQINKECPIEVNDKELVALVKQMIISKLKTLETDEIINQYNSLVSEVENARAGKIKITEIKIKPITIKRLEADDFSDFHPKLASVSKTI